jgi:hypothetical protein
VRYLKPISWIFWNALACAFWALLIVEDHRRAIALVVLLPLQLAVNFVIHASLSGFRISGLTMIYVIGLIAGLILVARYRIWWALIILILPVARIIWSFRRDRAKLLG